MSERTRIQRKKNHDGERDLAPPIVHEALRSGGALLDDATRAFMEPRFGRDFGAVRVHTDEIASQSAEAVNAHAYTAGHDLVFGEGQYQPGTDDGKRLIAHELAHVVQQSTANGERTRDDLLSRQEKEANHVKIGPQKMTDIAVPTFQYPMFETPIFGPISFDAGAFAGEVTVKQIWTGSAKPVGVNSLISISPENLKAKADVAFGKFSNGTSVKISPSGRLAIENEFSGPVGSVGLNINTEGALGVSMSGPLTKIVLHGFEIEASLGYELEIKIMPKLFPAQFSTLSDDESSIMIPILIGIGIVAAIGLIIVGGVVVAGAVGATAATAGATGAAATTVGTTEGLIILAPVLAL